MELNPAFCKEERMEVGSFDSTENCHKWNTEFKFNTALIHRGTRFVSVFQYVMDPAVQEKMGMFCWSSWYSAVHVSH